MTIPWTAPRNQQCGEREHDADGAEIQEPGIDHAVDLIRLVPGPVFGYELSDRSVETQVEKPEILDQGKYQHPDAIPLRPQFANNIGRKQKSNGNVKRYADPVPEDTYEKAAGARHFRD